MVVFGIFVTVLLSAEIHCSEVWLAAHWVGVRVPEKEGRGQTLLLSGLLTTELF